MLYLVPWWPIPSVSQSVLLGLDTLIWVTGEKNVGPTAWDDCKAALAIEAVSLTEELGGIVLPLSKFQYPPAWAAQTVNRQV